MEGGRKKEREKEEWFLLNESCLPLIKPINKQTFFTPSLAVTATIMALLPDIWSILKPLFKDVYRRKMWKL